MGIFSSATAAETSYHEGNRLCSHTDSGDRPSGQGRPCRGQKGPQGDSQGLVRHHHWWRGCRKNRDWPFWENSPKDCREFRRACQEARGRGLQREQVPQGHQRFHASGWRLHTRLMLGSQMELVLAQGHEGPHLAWDETVGAELIHRTCPSTQTSDASTVVGSQPTLKLRNTPQTLQHFEVRQDVSRVKTRVVGEESPPAESH